MKIIFLLLISLSLIVACKRKDGFQQTVDAAEDAPKRYHIQGVYGSIETDSSTRSILCLSGAGDGHYFIVRNGVVLKHGHWSYHKPPGEGTDYTIGPPGYGRIDFDWPSEKEHWWSYVFFDGGGPGLRLIIDTLGTFHGQRPAIFDSIKYGYEKVMWPYKRP